MNRSVDNASDPLPVLRPGGEADITLGMLTAVEKSSVVTQRTLARELGIALGLVNGYLRRCIGKGLIKVTTAPANRYAYYLTPQGFAEKSRLTAEYLALSFNFFRVARSQCREILDHCEREGWHRIVLCGRGELAEIVVLCAESEVIKLIGLLEPGGGASLGRLPLFDDVANLPEIDAAIVTDQRTPQATYERMLALLPRERVLTPDLLRVSRTPPKLAV